MFHLNRRKAKENLRVRACVTTAYDHPVFIWTIFTSGVSTYYYQQTRCLVWPFHDLCICVIPCFLISQRHILPFTSSETFARCLKPRVVDVIVTCGRSSWLLLVAAFIVLKLQSMITPHVHECKITHVWTRRKSSSQPCKHPRSLFMAVSPCARISLTFFAECHNTIPVDGDRLVHVRIQGSN